MLSKKSGSSRTEKKRFLIIKLWAIGEVILTTPLVKTLKKNYPDSYIAYLTGKLSTEILKNNKYIDEIISVDEDIFLNFKVIKIIKVISDLKKIKFNIVINLHHSILFNIFSFFTGALTRIGFNRNNEGFLNTIKVKPLPGKHKIDEYLELTRLLKIKKVYRTPDIFITEEDIKSAENFFIKNKIKNKDKLIGFLPAGSGNPASSKLNIDMERKVWPIEYYIDLAEIIMKRTKAKVIFFGGERESKFKKKISNSTNKNIINAIGDLSLKGLAAAAKRCRFIITNDSGPMHLLWASGIRIYTIFGPTDPAICGPLDKKSTIIRKKTACSPCFKGDLFPNFAKKCNNIECMRSIKPKDVYNLIRKSL